jgi:hypothetical protein
MKKLSILLIISFATIFSTQAQHLMSSTLGSGGTTKFVDGRYYSHVISQSSIQGTFSQHGMTVRQGFKQPLINSMRRNSTHSILLPTDESTIYCNAFPNPFSNKLTIAFSSTSTLPTDLLLYDMQGIVLLKKVYPPMTGEIQLTDFTYLCPGKYIIRISNNNKPITITVIKEGI